MFVSLRFAGDSQCAARRDMLWVLVKTLEQPRAGQGILLFESYQEAGHPMGGGRVFVILRLVFDVGGGKIVREGES